MNNFTSRDQSRREFLRRTAGMGLGVAALPLAEAAASPTASAQGCPSLDHRLRQAVELSISNIALEGLDDIFPRPFEIQMIENDPALRRDLFSSILAWLELAARGGPATRPAHSILLPKQSSSEYRRCALIDPLDALRYLALAVLVARVTEARRVPVDAKRVFSYRFDPSDSRLFQRRSTSASFQAETLARLTEHRETYLVRADIADFYPSITPTGLAGALSRLGVEGWIGAALNQILNCWEMASGGGIPVGPAATHILAEAVLISPDEQLLAEGVDFIRFVDDYRLFAHNAATADAWLAALATRLAAAGLRLNPAKTSIDRVSRADYATLLSQRDFGPLTGSMELDQRPRPIPCPSTGPRRPGCRPRLQLKQVEPSALLEKLVSADRVELPAFRALIEASFARRDLDVITNSLTLVHRLPYCLPYLVEFLIQESQALPASFRFSMAQAFGERLTSSNDLPTFEAFNIAKLLGSGAYPNGDAVIKYLSSMRQQQPVIVFRYLLEALGTEIDGPTTLSLLARCEGPDPWKRRAFLRLLLPHLDDEQQSALDAQWQGEDIDADPFWRAILAQGRRARATASRALRS